VLTLMERGRASPVLATVAAVLLLIVGILIIIYPALLAWIAGIGLVFLEASRSLLRCTCRATGSVLNDQARPGATPRLYSESADWLTSPADYVEMRGRAGELATLHAQLLEGDGRLRTVGDHRWIGWRDAGPRPCADDSVHETRLTPIGLGGPTSGLVTAVRKRSLKPEMRQPTFGPRSSRPACAADRPLGRVTR
jgi:hypothetical protein